MTWDPNAARTATKTCIAFGMALAIEPMFNLGTEETLLLEDGWTVVTRDGKLSAHFEHTVARHGRAQGDRDRAREPVGPLRVGKKRDGFDVVLISGDTTQAVEAFAQRLGIRKWIAEALP